MNGSVTELGVGPQAEQAAPDELSRDPRDSSRESRVYARRQAYARCMRWLGQRDHSSTELRRKLASRDVEELVIDEVIQELLEARYVDDERYAKTLVEQRSRRGYGPRYICGKLIERGIDRALADTALQTLEADWQDVACNAVLGRFQNEHLVDDSQRQQAKMARFLQARGFSAGDSLRAIQAARDLAAAGHSN